MPRRLSPAEEVALDELAAAEWDRRTAEAEGTREEAWDAALRAEAAWSRLVAATLARRESA